MIVWKIIGGLIYVYLVIIGYFYFNQSSFIYLTSNEIKVTTQDLNFITENIAFITSDGLQLNGWFIANDNSNKVLLFSHGNAGNISDRIDILNILSKLDLNIMIYDYRGYGNNPGIPTEEGTYQDARAAWEYLINKGFQSDQIIIYGRSLGGAVAAKIAAEVNPAGLIIDSSFISLTKLATDLYAWLPVRYLLKHKYQTIKHLKTVKSPVMIIHGKNDQMIPIEHSQVLFENTASNQKIFLKLQGGHNDSYIVDREKYLEGLNEFINRIN